MPLLNYLIARSNKLTIEPEIRSVCKRMLKYLLFETNIKISMNYEKEYECINPLIIALDYRDYDTAKTLIEKGANINISIQKLRTLGTKVKLIYDTIENISSDKFNTEVKIVELLNFFKAHKTNYDPAKLCDVYSRRKTVLHTVKIYECIVNSNYHLIPASTLLNLVHSKMIGLIIELVNLGANVIDTLQNRDNSCNLLRSLFWYDFRITKGSENAKLVKFLIKKGSPVDSEGYFVLEKMLIDLKTRQIDCYVFELIIKNGGVFRGNRNPVPLLMRQLANIPNRPDKIRLRYYNVLRVLYHYYGCEWEKSQSILERYRKMSQSKVMNQLINYVESWEKVPTLRIQCLRIVKTGKAGNDYKAFPKGYFEWHDEVL